MMKNKNNSSEIKEKIIKIEMYKQKFRDFILNSKGNKYISN
jgi:hypothetical protein